MDDLDRIIAQLREEPVPERLDAMEGSVMAGLTAARERLVARRGIVLGCAVAGLIGLWGGLALPGTQSVHEDPLLGLPAAAPSHLLAS
ncbi:hypothetical protein [Novosphingobium pentaromativorans]|uniref:hypothetical protein n=1 Tax=Novosphingobium pentaromativorans TaxID=205844 RepID=UPI0002E3085F|nr:hypothetical protein [Novosphingobium pentaromativorans]AIT82330.1 hypothetical protein JI59_22760 [Novosphingobium pentaromativorans US6-1]